MRRFPIPLAGFLLLFLLPPVALDAQAALGIAPGDRVRVWVPANGLQAQIATVDSVTGTGFALRVPRTPFPLLVSMDSITRLDVRDGGGGRSVTGGAALGGLIGLGAGFALRSGILPIPCTTDSECEVMYFGAIPAGFLFGALLGGALAADPWTRVWPRD